MHDANNTILSKRSKWLYETLLLLYPQPYQRRFSKELLIAFYDLYQEELMKHGKIRGTFWVWIYWDLIHGIVGQHFENMKQYGLGKYLTQTFSINRYNIIGSILLLPLFSIMVIDIAARMVQGDLTHYNRPVYSFLSHTPLYWYPVLFTWVIILPSITVIINLIPILSNLLRKHNRSMSWTFFSKNIVNIILLSLGLFPLLLIQLHDFIPCFVHGLIRVGLDKLPLIISVCRNA